MFFPVHPVHPVIVGRMLCLKLSLATILATASASSLDSLQTDATLHDYMAYRSGIADSNPPWCEVAYSSLDLSSVTAFGGVTKNTCGSCIKVCGSVGCKHLLVIDQCSRPNGQLDMSTGAGEQVCGATTGHCQVSVKAAGAQNCAHIWDGRMFYDYTPLYGGFRELKKYVDGKGGAAASPAPAYTSVQTSAPAPTSFVLPTSCFVPPTPVFTPPVKTTPAVVSPTPVYTPPVVSPPYPFRNSTLPASSFPTATGAPRGTGTAPRGTGTAPQETGTAPQETGTAPQETDNACGFPGPKTFHPITTILVTPTPIANPPPQTTKELIFRPPNKQEPHSTPTPKKEPATEPGLQPTLRATQTVQVLTTLTTRIVAFPSGTAPMRTAPSGVPLSTGTPGQGWNSTSSGAGSDSSGHVRRSGHFRGHLVGRGRSVQRDSYGRAQHGHAGFGGM